MGFLHEQGAIGDQYTIDALEHTGGIDLIVKGHEYEDDIEEVVDVQAGDIAYLEPHVGQARPAGLGPCLRDGAFVDVIADER